MKDYNKDKPYIDKATSILGIRFGARNQLSWFIIMLIIFGMGFILHLTNHILFPAERQVKQNTAPKTQVIVLSQPTQKQTN